MVLEDMRDLLLASDSPDQLFKPIRTLPIVIFLLASDVSSLGTLPVNKYTNSYSDYCYCRLLFLSRPSSCPSIT
jgi:hypothetical protein